MRGSIRICIGFFLVFGAVGTLDIEPSASVLGMVLLAFAGLAILWSGVDAMKGK